MAFLGLFGKKEGAPTPEEMGVNTGYSQSPEQDPQEMALRNQALENLSDEAGVVKGDAGDINAEMQRIQMENQITSDQSVVGHAPQVVEDVAAEMPASGVVEALPSQDSSIEVSDQVGAEMPVVTMEVPEPVATEVSTPESLIGQEAPEVVLEAEPVIADPVNLEASLNSATPETNPDTDEPIIA